MIYLEAKPVSKDDLAEINSWYRARNLPGMVAEFLPPQGFIIPEIAAGFLLKTTISVAFMEGFITNPKARPEFREAGLKLITEKLIQAANAGAVRRLMAITEVPKIKEMAKQNGFICLENHTVWGRDK